MLLFYEVLSRPSRRLILSYPALDAAAQPLTPSPYLYELQQICGEAWPLANQPRALLPRRGPLALRARFRRGTCPCPCAICAAGRCRRPTGTARRIWRNCSRRETGTRRTNRQFNGRLDRGGQRQRKDQFGPFEGLMATPAAGQLWPNDFRRSNLECQPTGRLRGLSL